MMEDILEEFRLLTGYDLSAFFDRYTNFVDVFYQSIVDYYNGSNIFIDAFTEFRFLEDQVKIIRPLWELHSTAFNRANYWVLLDTFSDIDVALQTINNFPRWLRSSRLSEFDSNVRVTRVLRQGQTFEQVATEIGFADINNTWTDIAIDNLAIEEDYTTEGGLNFDVSLRNNLTFDLPNIIDSLQGDNIYGKDIDRSFVFEDNDLKLVVARDAVRQTIDTILRTRKGSIPEFPADGIEEDTIGTNVSAIQYPVIFRNILSLFRKDGRFSEIKLLNLDRNQDSIFLTFEITTILKNSVVTNLEI